MSTVVVPSLQQQSLVVNERVGIPATCMRAAAAQARGRERQAATQASGQETAAAQAGADTASVDARRVATSRGKIGAATDSKMAGQGAQQMDGNKTSKGGRWATAQTADDDYDGDV